MEEITNYLNEIRRDYSGKPLDEANVDNDPIKQFSVWFEEAVSSQVLDPNAMVLSTVSIERKPSSRVVLLRGIENGCFNFYTNYTSKKGEEMDANPQVAVTFFWVELNRQLRIEGSVHKLSEEASKKYFASRPRESQIGAWASSQSKELNNRGELEKLYEEFQVKFEDKEVPKPPFWGGYAIKPNAIEFWQGRPNRLHDRILYKSVTGNWEIKRLAP